PDRRRPLPPPVALPVDRTRARARRRAALRDVPRRPAALRASATPALPVARRRAAHGVPVAGRRAPRGDAGRRAAAARAPRGAKAGLSAGQRPAAAGAAAGSSDAPVTGSNNSTPSGRGSSAARLPTAGVSPPPARETWSPAADFQWSSVSLP